MAKVKGGRRGRDPRAAAARAKASDRRIETLRSYYEAGRRALGFNPEGGRLAPAPIAELAVELGVEGDTIRKARDFARKYSGRELEALARLRDRRSGMPLTWCHVRELLAVPTDSKAVRSELQKLTAKEGWSVRELRSRVRSRVGGEKSSPGARSFARPSTPEDALRRLVELSESWLRYHRAVVDSAAGGPLERPADPPADGAGRERLDPQGTAREVLRKLARAAAAVAKRLREEADRDVEPGGVGSAKAAARVGRTSRIKGPPPAPGS
ncbi:DUF1016 domain-containing protein [Paludisphaera soli]|uniref:DUF1016 domain-containing protein n=1 Tax=Paludisphaera soli TaxID=2712865 RepID=UPI0013EC9863|nr:DUF1016 domain-containing protein [Paludisphaera soli]